jgi:hypothetical protein
VLVRQFTTKLEIEEFVWYVVVGQVIWRYAAKPSWRRYASAIQCMPVGPEIAKNARTAVFSNALMQDEIKIHIEVASMGNRDEAGQRLLRTVPGWKTSLLLLAT